MRDVTVVYYTANQELPAFEDKIRSALLSAKGNTPLISVSQKPMDFGHNICVGDVGVSNHNAFRQLQIGAMEAKTRFICTAESDFLYPPEYFEYVPRAEDVFYFAYKVYMVYDGQFFYSRRVNEGAMIVGRYYLIDAIEKMLRRSRRKWSREHRLRSLALDRNRKRINLSVPIVTFKTPENMHPKHHKRSYIKLEQVDRLPYWGTPADLMAKYYAN